MNKWKIIKEDSIDKELVTIDSIDRILKKAWDCTKKNSDFDITDIEFECSNLSVSQILLNNTFYKYWNGSGGVDWSKPKISPFDKKYHVVATLPKGNYNIHFTLESYNKSLILMSDVKSFSFVRKWGYFNEH